MQSLYLLWRKIPIQRGYVLLTSNRKRLFNVRSWFGGGVRLRRHRRLNVRLAAQAYVL
jgi:hypothetical protein